MAGLRETGAAAPPDFDEQTRAAEEAAGIPSDEELYGEFMARPEADEAGRIPASRAPDEEEVPAEEPVKAPVEEPEAPTEEPETEAVPIQTPLAEDTELAELKRKVGQMANENAELRKWQQEQEASWANAPQPQLDGQALAWFDEIVEQAPDQAAVWAAQQQQPLLYERAIRSWHDVDPVAAARYERSMEWNQLQQQMTERFQPQIQGAQELAANADREAAYKAVASRHDDFEQVVGGITTETADQIIASAFPTEILPSLLTSRDGAEKVLETLYRFVKSDQAPAMVAGAVEAVQTSQEEAKAAKRAATVASATTTTPAPVEESEGERLARVWEEQRPSMRSAWTGRAK